MDPVVWGSITGELFDKLDQARAQLEAGDIEPEREQELAEYIEHLEEQAEQAADEWYPSEEDADIHEFGEWDWRYRHDDEGFARQDTAATQLDNIDEAGTAWSSPSVEEVAAAEARVAKAVAAGQADPGAWAALGKLALRSGDVSGSMAAYAEQMADEGRIAQALASGTELTTEQAEWVAGEAGRDDGPPVIRDAEARDAAEPQAIDATQERVMDAADSVETARAGVTVDSAGGRLPGEQAHAQAVAGLDALLHDGDGFDDASRLDPASVAPGELVGSDQSDEAYPQEYSVAEDPYDYAFHHGGGEALPPVPTEFVTGQDDSASEVSYPTPWDAYRSGSATASELPTSHDGWLAEGREGGASPGQARAADAVAEAHDVVQAELQRPVEEQAAPQKTTAQVAGDNEGFGAAGSECDGVGC